MMKVLKGCVDQAEGHRYGECDLGGMPDASLNQWRLPCEMQVVWDECAIGAMAAIRHVNSMLGLRNRRETYRPAFARKDYDW